MSICKHYSLTLFDRQVAEVLREEGWSASARRAHGKELDAVLAYFDELHEALNVLNGEDSSMDARPSRFRTLTRRTKSFASSWMMDLNQSTKEGVYRSHKVKL